MNRTRFFIITIVSLFIAMVSPGMSRADFTVSKSAGINQYNPDLLDVWVQATSEAPAVVGTPTQGVSEFRPATQYPCNHATFSGSYTSLPEGSTSTATVLERRYVNSGTVLGTPNSTIVGSTVEYVIQGGPPQAIGVTIRRSDWESNGRTGTTFSCLRSDPNLGTPYFLGHAEGDIHGVLRFVGNDGIGHAITETRRTSAGGIQDTSVTTIVWDNPVINVVESEVVHTGVLIYTRSGTQFEYSTSDECINNGANVTRHTGESFYLPAYNVGHYRGSWNGTLTPNYGVTFSYSYNRTETTEVVPRVVGLLRVSAQNLITANGFAVGTVTSAFSDVYPAGRVISQSVNAGTLTNLASVINLVVSDGPKPAIPPCECDLNQDGRCNMRDWLVFGQDWGRIDCLTPGVVCECDLNKDGRCNMRDWLIFGQSWGRTNCPVFTNATLGGVWVTTAADNQACLERPYFIADGNGNFSDFGAFGVNLADPGHYTVYSNGGISLYEEPQTPLATGHLTSASSLIFTSPYRDVPTTSYVTKVTDRSLCAGTWSGTITQYNGTIHQIAFTVDSQGIVTSFSGFAGPVTGKMFSVNGQVSSFFRTGEPNNTYDQLTLVGTLNGNTINGFFLPDANDYNGTFQLIRQ